MNSTGTAIVIPCYNAAAVVERAVASAFGQTHRPIEVVCVDDGSTDATRDVLARLQTQYAHLHVLHQPNGGAPRARNAGLAQAKGAYVQFLDADDELLPDKIARQVAIAEAEAADFVAGSCRMLNLDGSQSIHCIKTGDPWGLLPRVQLGITSANLFRREQVLAVGGWDEGLKSSQEYDLMFRLLKNGAVVAFDEEPNTLVHKQQGSITQTNQHANSRRRAAHLVQIRDHLRDTGAPVTTIDVAEQSLFDEIRHLAKYDMAEAVQLFHEQLPTVFQPQISGATTASYLRIYRLLGFRRTEQVRAWARKLRKDPIARS